jgi:hypothetical protein
MATYIHGANFSPSMFAQITLASSREVTSCKNLTCFMTWPRPQFARSQAFSLDPYFLSCGCSIWVWRLFVCALCSQNLKSIENRLRLERARNRAQSFRTAFFQNKKKPISREGHCSKALDSLAHTRRRSLVTGVPALAAATEAGESKSSGERQRDLSRCCCEPTASSSSGGMHVRLRCAGSDERKKSGTFEYLLPDNLILFPHFYFPSVSLLINCANSLLCQRCIFPLSLCIFIQFLLSLFLCFCLFCRRLPFNFESFFSYNFPCQN